VQHLCVGVDLSGTTFVEIDQSGAATLPGGDVAIDGVVGQVGLGTNEPAERRR
jgi:hypothetical protein